MEKAIKQKSKRLLALLVMLCTVFLLPVTAHADDTATASVTMTFSLEGFGTVQSATMYYTTEANVPFKFNTNTKEFETIFTRTDGSTIDTKYAYQSVQAEVSDNNTVSATFSGVPNYATTDDPDKTEYYLIVIAQDNKGLYAIWGYEPSSDDGVTFRCEGGSQQLKLTVTDSNVAVGGGTFHFVSPEITTIADPDEGGRVTGGGYYAYNATAALTATPNSGYAFIKWSDDITSNPRTVTVTGNASYTAEFKKLPVVTVQGTGVTTTTEKGDVSGAAAVTASVSGDYYFPSSPTASTTNGSVSVTTTSYPSTSVTLIMTGLTDGTTVTVTGATQYLGKIGNTYYTDKDALIEAMKAATADTEIVLGSQFSTNGSIQMNPGVKIRKYDATAWTTTEENYLYSVSGGAVTPAAAEAKIGDTLYASLTDALTAAESGKTVQILKTAADDSIFGESASYTLKEGVTLSYTTAGGVSRSVTAVSEEATVRLSGQSTTLTDGSLTCTGAVNVVDAEQQTHSVYSAQEITVTAGTSGDEGTVSNVGEGQKVKIDSVTYTSAAGNTSFPLVGKELSVGETAEIDAKSAGTVMLTDGTEITAEETNTGAAAVAPKGEDGAAYTEVTLAESGDTVKIGTTEENKKSYTANEDNTVLIIGASGEVTLKSGEVSLEDSDSVGLTLNDGTVLNISNPAEETLDDDRVIAAGGDNDYAGYVTVKDGGSVQIGEETYEAPKNTEVVYAIGKNGTVKEIRRVVTLADGVSTTIFKDGDNGVYIENVNNNNDSDEIVVNIDVDNNVAEITVPEGTAHQVAVGTGSDSKVIYTNGSDTDEMILSIAEGGTVPTLTEGSVTVPKGEDVKVGETEYTAPSDADAGMTISVDENGKAVLVSGSVELDNEEAIIGVSGREIENTGDAAEPVVVKSTDGKDEITIFAGGSVTIDGVKYENKGDASATLIVGGDTALVQAGTVCVTPADKNTPAAVAVGGDSTVVSGTEFFTVTAGEGNAAGTATAKPGQTLTISGVEYTANPAGRENTTYDLGDPSKAMKQGDTAVFPNYPAADPDQSSVTVTVPTVTLGENTFTVPAPTYDSQGTLTDGNSGDVSVVKKNDDDGAATVTVEEAGDTVIINDEEYIAAADNTVLDVDNEGNVTLAQGGIELDNGKEITVNTEKVSFTSGEEPAAVTKNEDGSATLVIPDDTKVTVGGEALDGESVYKIDKDGTVILISKTTYLEDGKNTDANGVTVENPASSNGDKISVKQVEGGPATVTVPAGAGNEVVLKDEDGNKIAYSNASDTEALVLEIAEDGSITLTGGVASLDNGGSIAAAPEGGTPTLVTNASENESSTITVEIDNENGTTVVSAAGAGTVTIGEGDNAKTFTTVDGLELTVDKDGNVTVTGGSVKLESGESITVGGVTYIAPEGDSLTVTVNSETGEVTVTGTPAAIVIDPEKFKEPDFKFVMIPNVPVTVGDYVYETKNENVTLSGIENGNGNPMITLPAAGNVVNVSLAKDTTQTTPYTAAGANTEFTMSSTGSSASTEKSDLLGTDGESGLTFTGTTPVTVNGVTYTGGTEETTYNVMFGADGQNKVVLPDNGKEVTATFTASENSLVTEANQVNGENIEEDGSAETMPFTSASAPSTIVITKDSGGIVNVTSGSRSDLTPIKDGDGNITGYEVKRISSSGSSSGVNVTKPENGTVTVDKPNASYGQTVIITVTPDEGYKLGSLTVTDNRGNSVELTDLGNGKYSFVQPKNGPVTIKAIFVEEIECSRDKACPAYPFTDLDLNEWYHDGVHYCVENGLMNGYGNNLFGPNDNLSRAQLVQILYNKAGRPAVTGGSGFTDVASDEWYADAVTWAAANGIVEGYGNGLFKPNNSITREQLAVMLWRYAKFKGCDTAQGGMIIREFSDYESISGYATDAMTWAVSTGVISGYEDQTLRPQTNVTRAQAAQIFQNFLEKL